MIEQSKTTLPFLKWAGGKRWLTPKLNTELIIPEYKTYIEPFLGSGAVYFNERPQNAIIGDLNEELILTYQAIQEDWKSVFSLLKKYHTLHTKDFYYFIRNDSRPRLKHTIAARFIYLNRTCFNGIYRVNQEGTFNVPIGSKSNVILDTDDFEHFAKVLKNTSILHSDFEEIINRSQSDDFIFVDPPYTIKDSNTGFIKYNDKLFTWEDQIRLRDALVRASARGTHILMTNVFHDSIRRLYWGTGFKKVSLDRRSTISASSFGRGNYTEYIIKNF